MKSRLTNKIKKEEPKIYHIIESTPSMVSKMVSKSLRGTPPTTININVPNKEDMNLDLSNGLIQSAPLESIENGFTTETTTLQPGIQTIRGSYMNSDPVEQHIIVKNIAANTTSIVPSEFVIEVDQVQPITIHFDKDFPEDQQPPKIILDTTNLELVSENIFLNTKSSSSFSVRGLEVGSGVIECYVGGVSTPIYYSVIEKNNKSSIYQIIKNDLNKLDLDVINEYIATHEITLNEHDLIIIKVMEQNTIFAIRLYIYTNNRWIAANGYEQADHLILDDDIILAGNYNNIGNIYKEHDGQVLKTKGMSIINFLKSIFTQRIQPSVEELPKIINFDHNQNNMYEVGTVLNDIEFGSNAQLKQARYSFNQTSNVSIINTTIFRETATETTQISNILNGIDLEAITVTDEMKYIKYLATVQYSDDNSKLVDNLGDLATNNINIKSDLINVETNCILGYRKIFYGGLLDEDISSQTIRKINSIPNINIPNEIQLLVKPSTRHVIIAFPKDTIKINKIVNNTIMGSDVTDTFIKTSLLIPGINNYNPIEYDVYTFTPANPFLYETEFLVTLGGDNNE